MPSVSRAEIKTALMPLKGRKVKLTAKAERNRIMRAVGIIDGVYPSLFTVLIYSDGHYSRYSYTYNEIITEKVTITPIKHQ